MNYGVAIFFTDYSIPVEIDIALEKRGLTETRHLYPIRIAGEAVLAPA